jgi:hypothetical protein
MRRRRSTLALAAALSALLLPGRGHAAKTIFMVGAAKADISPSQALIDGGHFYLGGFGLASGTVGTGPATVSVTSGRLATGVMEAPGKPDLFRPWVRAVAIGDGTTTVVIVDLDNQGMFAAYKDNPSTLAHRPGIDEIREAVEDDIGLPARNIVISSDHSHAGQDLTGVWGLVPDSYFDELKTKAVGVIEAAVAAMVPARIKAGSVHTPDPCEAPADPPQDRIFNNQFSCSDTGQNSVDSDVRVLQAFATRGDIQKPMVTLVNAAIHATVMGSGNRLVSSDWPSTLAEYVEERYGGLAVTVVGDVGRTQPNRGGCVVDPDHGIDEIASGQFDVDPRAAGESCKLSKYARRVLAWVDQAVAAEEDLTVRGVAATDLFIRDPSHSVILFGLNYAGDAVGAPIARATTPPYLTGAVLGTWVGVFRVGDLMMLSAPGEAYPNIRDQVLASVNVPASKAWIYGLANDQLGYLIAPFPEGYPAAIQHGATGNDNYFFNVSHTLGDHIMCTMLKGAAQVGFATHDVPAKCGIWAAEPNTP